MKIINIKNRMYQFPEVIESIIFDYCYGSINGEFNGFDQVGTHEIEHKHRNRYSKIKKILEYGKLECRTNAKSSSALIRNLVPVNESILTSSGFTLDSNFFL